jgi:uncharacterized protein YgiM (DUF1202 family)
MSLVGVFKFCLGLILALAILAGGSFLAAQYVKSRMAILPPKPTFPNDNAKNAQPTSNKPAAKSANAVPESPPPTPSPSASPKPLPPGAYHALVTEQIGLVLREAPGREARTIGGVGYNEKVIILETNADGSWQKVRTDLSDQEGWVRGGNTEKVAQ